MRRYTARRAESCADPSGGPAAQRRNNSLIVHLYGFRSAIGPAGNEPIVGQATGKDDTKALLAVLAIVAGLVVPVGMPMQIAFAQESLGLAERRALKNYQDKIYPDVLKEIQAAAGMPLTVEIAWDKIALPGQAANYDKPEFWGVIFFKPLTEALKTITIDAMGKDAVKAKLQKVVVTYDAATAPASNYPNGVKFADGVLTMNFAPGVNIHDVKERTDAIRQVLEKSL